MDIHITASTVITTVSLLSAVGTVLFWVLKAHKWFLNQEAQDEKIKKMETDLKKEIQELREKHDADMKKSKSERRVVCFGLSACLDGLLQLGCNHTVPEAKTELDKYLNEQAHE